MKSYFKMRGLKSVRWSLAMVLALLMGTLTAANTQAFTLNVVWVDQDGNSWPVDEYRWLLQEDTTIDPLGTGNEAALSLGFHTSYAPPVAKGDQDNPPDLILDPNKRYFVSVLPAAGYTIGGAPVVGGIAEVKVTPLPLPTAQISVLVFRDDYPINNAPDFNEPGLEGFKVTLEDAGGRYGMSAGAQMMDAFGNPIGTVYGQDGNVVKMGDGVVTTDADGHALIQNLAPGKYGVSVVPPLGEGWVQTSTIEGKRVIDAWVKANEPPFFVEFGPPGYHVFIGFVKEMNDLTGGSNSINGRIVNLHNSRPPDFTFWPGHPIPGAWVGLNNGPAGTGQGVYAAPCDGDSKFTINGIPNGTYELVIWDENLDVVFATKNITLPDDAGNLGDIGVFNWFGRLEGGVFEDTNLDGVWDPDEEGIPEQAINIRWRDGTMYQSMPTDLEGLAPFDEVFPFFHWLVGEVDFARLQATGATFVVDAGGEVAPGEVLNPQEQYQDCDGAYLGLSRTETGEVLTQAFQVFLGQTVRMEFGKAPYNPDDNGGISGIVYYATTRAEDDPGLAAAEPWEPGVPRVQVNLYTDELNNDTGDPGSDGKIDPKGPATYPYSPILADVDNYPFGWSDGGTKGPEDIDRNNNGDFDWGDAIDITWTDSWDDNQPDCAMGSNNPAPGSLFGEHDAFDGLRNFNQARPGVFDGGYAFGGLTAGIYIVEAAAPPGYEHVKEEDKNVDFGDEYTGPFIPMDGNPAMPGDPPGNTTPGQIPLDNQAIPVGDLRMVPAELSLFPGVPTRFAGEMRPLPDRKQVELKPGLNSACDFFLFTEVPVAGQLVGIILDDTANEFDPAAPAFGEKYAPPFLPISIRDWAGNLIGYTVSDKYGAYNALVPSTYTANLPQPSGMSPHMLTVILNDPTHPTVAHNPKYSQFTYTFQYMPGTTTYLDTPVVPIAAFAGPGQFPVDSEFPTGTPVIKQVNNGPYVAKVGGPITIQSMGNVLVPNPAYDGTNSPTVERDYGFGATPGTVTIGGVPLTNVSWSAASITGNVRAGTTTGQLVVTRSNGKASVLGVTVTVGGKKPTQVSGPAPSAIQKAINKAKPGDMIMVGPGVYEELVIMTKPVQLQGWGAGVTFINAVQVPSEKILNWRDKIQELWLNGAFDLLPAQEVNFVGLEPALAAVEGAGISVFARNTTQANGGFGPNPRARIDGFTVEGASTGGGIFVNGYARFLKISNNRIRLNSAAQGGGITIGHPNLALETAAGLVYQDAGNDHIRIHNNQIVNNGGLGGAGGGVSLYTGAHYYQVKNNFIVGNFMQDNGGGIGHLGRSDGGVIANNTIAFNQSFNQGVSVSGGGIFIGGAAPLVLGELTEGSGSVTVDGNLIQGNLAGAGEGGGIRTQSNLPGDSINIISNMVVNNVAGLAGGGIAMQDTENINILHNTVAHNDSTATAGAAFATANVSTPQPAGIMSRNSNPVIDSNIIWENRQFHFEIVDPVTYGLQLDGVSDLGPVGLPTTNCLLTGGGDPGFAVPYFNNPRGTTIIQQEFTTTPSAMPAFDEGGNFIDVRYSPLSMDVDVIPDVGGVQVSDYHVTATIGGGTPSLTSTDVDGDLADGTQYIGADLYSGSTNVAPVAVNDAYTFPIPGGAGNVLANDFDPDDSGTLEVNTTPVTSPSDGILTLNSDGSFTLVGLSVEGVVTFSYLASDGTRGSVATVVVTVESAGPNNPPVPTAADIFTQINTPGTTRILPNDPDFGDIHTYQVKKNPDNGKADVLDTGTVTYTPDTNYLGIDSFVVTVTDQGGTGVKVDITINVTVSLNLPPSQDVAVQIPPDEDGIDTDGDGDTANDHAYLLLGAGDGFSTMADGYQQYIFSFRNLSHLLPAVLPGDPAVRIIPMDMIMHHGMLGAEWPAPTIRVREGQKLYLNLVNVGMHKRPDLFDPHTVHWHGFPQASSVFDGVPDASISINMMGILTYYYNVVEPGTYMYHCHVEATEHMQMGMLGNLYVTPKQDNRLGEPGLGDPTFKGFAYNDEDGSTGYHVDYPIQIGGFDPAFHDASLTTQPLPFQLMVDKYPMLNGRGYPDTLEQGSLPPSEANRYYQGAMVSAGPNKPPEPNGPDRFYISVDVTEIPVPDYKGLDIVLTSGAYIGFSSMIQEYNVTYKNQNQVDYIQIVLADALPGVPAVGDTFDIGRTSQNVNSRIEATQGQRILLRISSLDVTRFYTLASAIPMKVVGLNARLLRGPDGKDLYYTTNSVTLGGGEAVDAIIDTTDVAPGTYLLYTTNLNYLSNNQEDFGGIMTEIVITAP
jgi:hypothetical protein